jgi:hypothetical protein
MKRSPLNRLKALVVFNQGEKGNKESNKITEETFWGNGKLARKVYE